LQQPRVLDCYNGLSSEVRDQGDLFVGKGTDLLTVQAEHTEQFVLLQHRHEQKRSYSAKFDGCYEWRNALLGVGRLRRKIGYVSHRFGRYHAINQRIASRRW